VATLPWQYVAQGREIPSLMATSSASLQAWARQLLTVQAGEQSAADNRGSEVVRVCERMRISLTRFVGADGFTALLRRALALARVDVPSLQAAKITADGHLWGFEEFAADTKNDIDAAIAITAHLLGLLVTFIGEPLTLNLMRDSFPAAPGATT
jgi:hypothetical protein